jgi:hypothetical protein
VKEGTDKLNFIKMKKFLLCKKHYSQDKNASHKLEENITKDIYDEYTKNS